MANAVSSTRRSALQSLGALSMIAVAAATPARAAPPKQSTLLLQLFDLFQIQWENTISAARTQSQEWSDSFDDCTAIARVISMIPSTTLTDIEVKETIATSKYAEGAYTWGLDFETSVKLKLIAKAERSALIGGAA